MWRAIKKTSPAILLKGVDIHKSTLTRQHPVLVGTLELDYGADKPFQNTLYDIPDITVDLTPRSKELPRNSMRFLLKEGNKKIIIDALFDNTSGEYWKHYGNDKALEVIVIRNLQTLLPVPAKEWQTGSFFDAWSVKSSK